MFSKISSCPPKTMKQQLFIAGGSGTCTVLKLLPVTCMNQRAGGQAKGSEHSHLACAGKGEQAGTQQPRATDFYVAIFLFGKRNFLPELRWKPLRQQLSRAHNCDRQRCAELCARRTTTSTLKISEPFPSAIITFYHPLSPEPSSVVDTPGLSWCRIKGACRL